ncbi:MAG: RtcB family protein [Limnochordaceae bacterium]|nr:RtcB family protein [Limnochordaceae bacterium]
MRVDAVVYLNAALRQSFREETALQQLADAASLPGVVSRVVGMPDIHQGFGLPIGGVVATDADTGVVSAGAVGYDINCGVRLIRTNLTRLEMNRERLQRVMRAVEDRIPAGVGKQSRHKELLPRLPEVLTGGAAYLVEEGYGVPEDVEATEEYGRVEGADLAAVSQEALERAGQLATIGGGNHFVEIGYVEEVFDRSLAGAFGLEEGQVTVLVHSGSRGFGHQVCSDYAASMAGAAARYGIDLPSKGLAAAPIDSPLGQRYLGAMHCAINFAFANRQLMTHDIRRAFEEAMGSSWEALGMAVVYDVAHNIAKFERHFGRRVLVHRKGATRALPPGHPVNPRRYLHTGHPVLIPGSMGTASYVAVGQPGIEETFTSANHGAGRVLSRAAARRQVSREAFHESLGDVLTNVANYRAIVDEAPQAYKDIDAVVETLAEIGLTRKVARLRPLAVIKGEGD